MSLLFHGVGLTHYYSDASKNSDAQLTFVRVASPLPLHSKLGGGAFSKRFFCMLV